MLLLPFVDRQPATGYALTLASTSAGNAVLVGSVANLIVAEQAEHLASASASTSTCGPACRSR